MARRWEPLSTYLRICMPTKSQKNPKQIICGILLRIPSYHWIAMAIKMANNLPEFFTIVDLLSTTTVGKDHVMVHII